MIIFVAKSRDGWGVLNGADLVEEFSDLDEARSFASGLCDEAAARGEVCRVVDPQADDATA